MTTSGALNRLDRRPRRTAATILALSALVLGACGSNKSQGAAQTSAPSLATSSETTTTEPTTVSASAIAQAEQLCRDDEPRLASLAPLGTSQTSAVTAITAFRAEVITLGAAFTAIAWNDAQNATATAIAAEIDATKADLDAASQRVDGTDLAGAATLFGDAHDHIDQIVSIVRHEGAACGKPPQPTREGTVAPSRVVSIGGYTAQVAAHGNDVWIAVQDTQSVVRVDASTASVVATISVADDDLRTLQVTSDGVWVRGANAMNRIDPATNRVVQTIAKQTIGAGVGRAFVDDLAIWACAGNSLIRASKTDGTPIATISLPYPCGTVSTSNGQVWVASDAGTAGQLTRIDPTTNMAVITVAIAADSPTFPSIASDVVWTNSQFLETGQIAAVGVDASTGKTVAVTKLDSGGGTGALRSGAYFTVDTQPGVVDAIDAHTGTITTRYDAGAEPNALAIDGDTMWVVDEATGHLLRFDLGEH